MYTTLFRLTGLATWHDALHTLHSFSLNAEIGRFYIRVTLTLIHYIQPYANYGTAMLNRKCKYSWSEYKFWLLE